MLKKVLVLLGVVAQISLFAEVSQGETLERALWDDIVTGKYEDVKNIIAPCFQSVNLMGAYGLADVEAMWGKYKAADLAFSNFKVTESQDLLIVTYILQSKLSLGEKTLISKDLRLSVWQKIDNAWKWVAYANVTPGQM